VEERESGAFRRNLGVGGRCVDSLPIQLEELAPGCKYLVVVGSIAKSEKQLSGGGIEACWPDRENVDAVSRLKMEAQPIEPHLSADGGRAGDDDRGGRDFDRLWCPSATSRGQ
jgi:hypothetical protein